MEKKELKIVSFQIGHYHVHGSILTYSIIGLSEEGKLYRYDRDVKKWIPYDMEIHESSVK